MMNNITIGDLSIDALHPETLRDFYAALMGWEKKTAFSCPAVLSKNGLLILFMEVDCGYVRPVWPEESGKQQKQMHLDFTVDDVTAAVENALRLGATKAADQYGGETCVTMLDPEGHPFCLCKRWSAEESEFVRYFKEKRGCEIPDESINIDCPSYPKLREFYAKLFADWDRNFHETALLTNNGMVVHFMESDFDYVPPIWPEEPGKQQKQMHFNFQVDDLPSAVDEATRFGAVKAASQYGGEHYVTMLDPEGHLFCLCRK
ncbi:MAG: VOC family protein [Eubacteriales bacterium]|nr:VOC family protein [Eubacteriales bacterium]